MTDANATSTAPGYVPPPYLPPPTIGERLLILARRATATPVQAALSVVGGVAAAVAVVSLHPVDVRGIDRSGPFVARCGIGYYVAGHPDPVVAQVCHAAYGGHALSLALAAATLAIAAVVITCLARPAGFSQVLAWLGATRARAALSALVASAAVIGALALRTVTVQTSDPTGPLAAHCGLIYYVVGSSDPAVQQACRKAFKGHAEAIGICVAIVVAGLVALIGTAATARRPG